MPEVIHSSTEYICGYLYIIIFIYISKLFTNQKNKMKEKKMKGNMCMHEHKTKMFRI